MHTHTTHTHIHICTQVKILEESGQLPLAYVAASVHGLHEDADRIGQSLPELPELPEASHLLQPPTPILKVGGRGGSLSLMALAGAWPAGCCERTAANAGESEPQGFLVPQSAGPPPIPLSNDVGGGTRQ